MNQDLLTYVFEKSNATYLSDLKFIRKDSIIDILKDVKIADYTIADWKEFYLYIVGKETTCETKEEIKEELICNMI